MSTPTVNLQSLAESLQLTQLLFEKTVLTKHLAEQLYATQNEKEALKQEIVRLEDQLEKNKCHEAEK